MYYNSARKQMFIKACTSLAACMMPDLLQVEDSGRDPLDTVHHLIRVWRPLASHHYVLVQVQLPPHCRVL